MVQDAVGNNDLALWWSQQVLQVQFAFMFKKILEVEVISFLSKKWKEFYSLARKISSISTSIDFCKVGLSWVSQ
jgi:hypothetical protein